MYSLENLGLTICYKIHISKLLLSCSPIVSDSKCKTSRSQPFLGLLMKPCKSVATSSQLVVGTHFHQVFRGLWLSTITACFVRQVTDMQALKCPMTVCSLFRWPHSFLGSLQPPGEVELGGSCCTLPSGCLLFHSERSHCCLLSELSASM